MQALRPEYQRVDTRGCLTQISTGNWKQINYLEIKKNNSFGGHYHKHKKELFYITKGEINFRVIDKKGGQNINLKKGECILIEPYDLHTLYAVEDSELIELLSYPYNENDIWKE